MTKLKSLGLLLVALSLLGGTCSEPPAYRDVSGNWAHESWGPDATMTSAAGDAIDIDIAMSLQAAVPKERGPVAVSGSVCVRDPKLGLTGTYPIDGATSTWSGADYGGTRLDVTARAPDGRSLSIQQAFMHNAAPDELENANIELRPANGAPVSFRLTRFVRRADVSCP